MILISFDRLLCSILHVKYDSYITSKRVKKVIFAFWVISILMIVPYIFRIQCLNGMPLLLGGVFIIVSLCAYGSIIHVILRGRKYFDSTQRPIKRNLKMYTVPCLIIASFFIFYQIPLVIHCFVVKVYFNFSELNLNLVHCCYMVGFLADLFIYIFLDEKVRKFVISTICCASCSLNEVNKQADTGMNHVLDNVNARRHTNSTEA